MKKCELLYSIIAERVRLKELRTKQTFEERKSQPSKPKGSSFCQFTDCCKRASYGDPILKIVRFCTYHKSEHHVNLYRKTCEFYNCRTTPIYGDPIIRVGRFCRLHKPDNYIDIKNSICKFIGCSIQCHYGDPKDRIPQFCINHKPEHYINVRSPKLLCRFPECNITASYGEYTEEFCTTHKLEHHIHIKAIICEFVGCSTTAYYGDPITKVRQFCCKHKLENHINFKNNPVCKFPNCKIIPVFGDPINGVVEFCKQHKLKNHIRLKKAVCEFPGCLITKNFGFPGYSPKFCTTHKELGMVVSPTKYKPDEFKTCEYCLTKIYPTDQFCKICKVYANLGTTIDRKHKESSIKLLLHSNNIIFTHDLKIKSGCSQKRPDFVIDLPRSTIIIEVDEHQHLRSSYTPECEIIRMRQIFFDVGLDTMIFIRYNPDKYKPGPCIPDETRKTYLLELIQFLTTDDTYKGLGVIYLFYDNFNESITNIQTIDPYGFKSKDS